MRRFLLLALLPSAALGCKCEFSLSVCNEVEQSRVVFIGTVQSVEPRFLDRWNTERTPVSALNSDFRRALEDKSGGSLERLKQSYLKTFPDLPEEGKRKIHAAKAPGDFASIFTWVLEHGRTIRFQARTVYREADDDGDEKHEPAPDTFDIWTPFGDCGFNFQAGETYLVYAAGDEESPMLSTSVCSRTRRLTDAGEDLAYLYFYEKDRERSSRLEGFVTTNEYYLRDYDPKQFLPAIPQPVARAVVELRSEAGVRYTESDAGGRFTFDGLAGGEYTATAYGAGFPDKKQVAAGPKKVTVAARGCAAQVLIAPK